jgi:hypothetical protein
VNVLLINGSPNGKGGTSVTFDKLNKYFTISGMPVASSQYVWIVIHNE